MDPEFAWQDVNRRLAVSLASSDQVRQWTTSEVSRPETIHPGTRRLEPLGLFSERIFGREGDWECNCGRLRGPEQIGFVCIECDTPVKLLRGTRLGCIELNTPVAHPSGLRVLALLLNYTPAALRQVLRG